MPKLLIHGSIIKGGIYLEQIKDCLNYLGKAMSGIKVATGFLLTSLGYIMFPEQAYKDATIALGIAMLMDIFSKYVAISINSGGLRKAFKEGKIFSRTLWEGTRVKLITYLSISIMVGASYQLNTLPNTSASISQFMATVVYTVLYLREFQSMLENFRDAGADVEWLLVFTKKKEKEILKEETKEKEVDKDHDKRI
jgi:hypothetical protein